MKASKLTARGLAYVVRAVGRKIAKVHRAKQTPHGKQTVKKLMAHGTSTNSLHLFGDRGLAGLGLIQHLAGIFRKAGGHSVRLPGFEEQQVFPRFSLIKGVVHIPFPGYPVKELCVPGQFKAVGGCAFYQTEPGKYLLFFKSGQADAMTACFSEYSRKVLDKAKSRQPTIPEQMKQAEQQLAKEKPPKEHIKEVSHDR